MGRIRTVKPELFTHEDLFTLESETNLPVRLAFVGLFTVCDREGRFKWEPNRIKLAVLPYDQIDFSRVLDALLTRGMVGKYEVDGRFYGFIPTFGKHQVINNRESSSDLPEPNEINTLDASSTREARVNHASSTPLVHAQGEGKGKERKGKEGEGVQPLVPPNGETGEVFTYWQQKLNHQGAKLDAKREKAIKGRLKDGYTVGQLCQAIDGCAIDPFSQGKNDRQAVFDDIELICRSGPKVDQFIRIAQRGPANGRSQAQNATISNLQRYLEENP